MTCQCLWKILFLVMKLRNHYHLQEDMRHLNIYSSKQDKEKILLMNKSEKDKNREAVWWELWIGAKKVNSIVNQRDLQFYLKNMREHLKVSMREQRNKEKKLLVSWIGLTKNQLIRDEQEKILENCICIMKDQGVRRDKIKWNKFLNGQTKIS